MQRPPKGISPKKGSATIVDHLSDSCVSLASSEASLYDKPPIFVCSTSTGYNVEQRVRIVLAQFPGMEEYPVVKIPSIKTVAQAVGVAKRAAQHGSMVVSTLICREMRTALDEEAAKLGLKHVDLTEQLVEGIAEFLGQQPLEQPNLYWTQHREDFDRISAIEFTLAHDDGRRPEGWPLADIVLLGPSRSGKTPLSVYLGVLGYKVANIPLCAGVDIPAQLYRVIRGRVVGLTLDPDTLQAHRNSRSIGVQGTTYTDADAIYEELQDATRLYRRNGFHVVSIKDRAIEACAEEVVKRVTMLSGLPRRSSAHALSDLAAIDRAAAEKAAADKAGPGMPLI